MSGCADAGISKSTVVVSNTAGAICDAMNRCHTSWYSLNWSGLRYRFTSSGRRAGSVGRTASCASCAFLLLFFPSA